jgi:hypothetical protein
MADFRFKDPTNTRTAPLTGDGFPMDRGSPDVTRRYSQLEDLRAAFETGGSEPLELSSDQILATITQASHGLSVGPVGHNGASWIAADASAGATPCHAYLMAVVDASTFKVAFSGVYTLTAHGYTLGLNYLSTTAGQIQATPPPLGNVRQRVLVATDANTVLLTIGEPQIQ